MHVYIFGSLCRGDITVGSDVDMLALVEGRDDRFDPDVFSIYSYKRLGELWIQGNPFAWHLALESKLIFASDAVNYIETLGMPSPYRECVSDCEKFYSLFLEASESILHDRCAEIFDLSTIFLSIRNIATCYSLGVYEHPDFSRHSALRLLKEDRVPLSVEAYATLEQARILTTRGCGDYIEESETKRVIAELDIVKSWMQNLHRRAKANGST